PPFAGPAARRAAIIQMARETRRTSSARQLRAPPLPACFARKGEAGAWPKRMVARRNAGLASIYRGWIMAPTARGRRANGPDCEWLDLMVKNRKDELQRQLARVRDAEDGAHDAKSRAADARTLAALQNTLERLGRLEQQRALVRESKVAKHADGA